VPTLIEKFTLVSGSALTFSRITVRTLVFCSVDRFTAARAPAAPWPVVVVRVSVLVAPDARSLAGLVSEAALLASGFDLSSAAALFASALLSIGFCVSARFGMALLSAGLLSDAALAGSLASPAFWA
jgi:hypothetical protein